MNFCPLVSNPLVVGGRRPLNPRKSCEDGASRTSDAGPWSFAVEVDHGGFEGLFHPVGGAASAVIVLYV